MADDSPRGFSLTDALPKLVMGGGRAQAVLNTLEATLAEAGDIFRQGEGPNLRGVILREPTEKQIQAMEKRGIKGTRGLLLPVPLTRSHVQDYAERNFTVVRLWRNPKTQKTEELPADFTPALATRMIEARLDVLRPLNGIAYTPIMRADGTLVRTAGYDEETGLWIVAGAPHFDLPDRPTKADAQGYYDTLADLLAEHPFETDEDKVAGVAFLMAPTLRASMQRVPLLVADAPYGRTGKNYLLGTSALIGTGRLPVIVSLSENREEQQKRIGHALLLGAPVVDLTNINGVLRSDELAAYLTEGGTVTRSYGTTGGAKYAPNGNTMMADGNNIELGGDLPEREMLSRQDARMEYPGERIFERDPHGEVLADRGKYLAAVFGLARHAIRGVDYEAPKLGGLGGFDEFNRLIRAPLLALTGKDAAGRAKKQIVGSRQQRPERAVVDALVALFTVRVQDGNGNARPVVSEAPFCAKDIARELKKRAVLDGEDAWESLRGKQQDLGYRLRRAIGKRGATHQLTVAEKPQGGTDVAFYQLDALPNLPTDSAEASDTSPLYSTSSGARPDEDSRMGGTSAKSFKSAGNGNGLCGGDQADDSADAVVI